MAAFDQCIAEGLANGEISADAATMAKDAYDDALSAADGMGANEADRFAAAAAMRKLEAERIEARRRKALQIRARIGAEENAAAIKKRLGYDGDQPPEQRQALDSMAGDAVALELSIHGQGGSAGSIKASVDGRRRALLGKTDALFVAGIEKFQTRLGYDTPGRAHMPNVIREAFGEDTGDQAAKEIAGGFKEAAEYLRRSYNQAGGAIGKLDDWGMPQRHSAERVRRAAGPGVPLRKWKAHRAAWVAQVMPRLDRARMIDRATGVPMSEKRLIASLEQAWDGIVSHGANKRAPGEGLGKGMMAKRRAEARFLVFRNADEWMAYQADFAGDDIYELMHGHLEDLASDVALMQVHGPNPDAQIDWLKNRAMRAAQLEEARGVKGAVKKAERTLKNVDDMMFHYSGAANTPLRPGVAAVGAAARAGMSGVALGSSIIQEVPSNAVFGRMSRGFVGLDQNGDMTELARLLSDPKERAIARRSGFILESARDGFVRDTQDRLRLMTTGEATGERVNGLVRRLPAFTLRASLMTPVTNATKHTFQFEFMGNLHDKRGLSLDGLLASDDELTRTLGAWLKDRGFTSGEWDVIRSTPPWRPREGVEMLRPMDVQIEDLALRLSEGIDNETQFVTPEARLWTRAKLLGQSRPGTVFGELRRSWVMFRGFSLTAAKLYGQEVAARSFARADTTAGGWALFAAWGAGALAFMTIAGAVGTQVREITKGNDPRPMNDPRFWAAAMMAGGGLSIVGDFFYSAQARNGKSSSLVAMGPPAQVLSDTWNLTAGNAYEIGMELLSGEDMEAAMAKADPGRDLAQAARTYNPFASIWWARTVYHRLLADNLQRALDPEAEEAFQRRARRMERETGQTQWWPQGQNAPDHAPDLSLMAGAD